MKIPNGPTDLQKLSNMESVLCFQYLDKTKVGVVCLEM
jgi:hypothetical protein